MLVTIIYFPLSTYPWLYSAGMPVTRFINSSLTGKPNKPRNCSSSLSLKPAGKADMEASCDLPLLDSSSREGSQLRRKR